MIAGVDGCRAGWVVAISDIWPCLEAPCLLICRDFACVLAATKCCSIVLVDIPIGLPTGNQRRQCDLEAKNELGREGGSRVFLAPPRESLDAKDAHSFQAKVRALTGKGAGYPVWPLVGKLLEVDEAMNPKAQDRVFEFHPELVWKRLSGRTLTSKGTKQGIAERRDLLLPMVPKLDSFIDWPRHAGRAVRADDILDALVGLVAAIRLVQKPSSPSRLPASTTVRDSRSLRMEMWF